MWFLSTSMSWSTLNGQALVMQNFLLKMFTENPVLPRKVEHLRARLVLGEFDSTFFHDIVVLFEWFLFFMSLVNSIFVIKNAIHMFPFVCLHTKDDTIAVAKAYLYVIFWYSSSSAITF